MPDPFDLSQYVTSFNKVSKYVPSTFQFADFDAIFSQVAEAIRMRQAGISIGFSIPENAFVNVESYDTSSPSGLSDSIYRFQSAIRELVSGHLLEEYGKLPDCNVYIGFFHYSNGYNIIGVPYIVPNGVDFTVPPDPMNSSNIIEFAKEIGSRINELIFSLNILTLLHGKMVYQYPYDNYCQTNISDPGTSQGCVPRNDNCETPFWLDVRNRHGFVGPPSPSDIRCTDGSTICATIDKGLPSPNVWFIFYVPGSFEFGDYLADDYFMLVFSIRDGNIYEETYNNWKIAVWDMGTSSGSCDQVGLGNIGNVHYLGAANPVGICVHRKHYYRLSVYCTQPGQVGQFRMCWKVTTCIPIISLPSSSLPPSSSSGVILHSSPGGGHSSPPPPPPQSSNGPPPPPQSSNAPPPPHSSPTPPPYSSTVTGGCFLSGTKITMADGATKSIEEVRVGDVVMCYNIPSLPKDTEEYLSCSFKDVSQHKFTTRKVLANKIGQEPMYFIINKKIKVTHEHPFFVRIGDAWRYVEAQNMRKGYRMLGPDGEVAVRSVEPVFDTTVQTFNLTVDDANSFIAEGVVVHNVTNDNNTKTFITLSGNGTGTAVTGNAGGKFFGFDEGSSNFV